MESNFLKLESIRELGFFCLKIDDIVECPDEPCTSILRRKGKNSARIYDCSYYSCGDGDTNTLDRSPEETKTDYSFGLFTYSLSAFLQDKLLQ